jgi:hypothetical protein
MDYEELEDGAIKNIHTGEIKKRSRLGRGMRFETTNTPPPRFPNVFFHV